MGYHGYHFWFRQPYPKILRKIARMRQVAPECLLQTHLTFSKSVMVSMGVSKLRQIDLIFMDAKVSINGAFYCHVFPTQKLLPIVREICGEFFNLPARQCYCPSSALDNQPSGMTDTCVHFTRPFAAQHHRSAKIDYKICGETQQWV